jgi:hypothetical protein
LPENTRAELRRKLGRLRLLREQIHEIEHERLCQLAAVSTVEKGPRGPASSHGLSAWASKRRTCWSTSFFCAACATAEPSVNARFNFPHLLPK